MGKILALFIVGFLSLLQVSAQEIKLTKIEKSYAFACEKGSIYQIDFRNLVFPSVDKNTNKELFDLQKEEVFEFLQAMENLGLNVLNSTHLHQIQFGKTWHAVQFCTVTQKRTVQKIFRTLTREAK